MDLQAQPISAAYVQVNCTALRPMLDFFLEQLKFRVNAIFPADDPQTALISGYGLNVYLATNQAQSVNPVMRLLCNDPNQVANGRLEFEAPDGLRVHLMYADPPMVLPPTRQELVVSRLAEDSHWSVGRADLRYRDLLPKRHGGAFIASHIRVLAGGPVPDYVHFHKVRFQMIFCRKGWVKVVYDGQGEPFKLEAGDCVLQPPLIRHRVLESSAGAEVIEIASPAQHITIADHTLELPSSRLPANHDFSGQTFVRHIAHQARWIQWRLPGFSAADTGIATATRGIASVRKIRTDDTDLSRVAAVIEQSHQSEFSFYFVLSGNLELTLEGQSHQLRADDCITIPGDSVYTISAIPSTEFLEVMLPAEQSFSLRNT